MTAMRVLSLPCPSLWESRFSPPSPAEALAALPGEFRRLRELGAGLVEFPGDVTAVAEAYASPGLWARVAGLLEAEGLGATVHLPFAWVDLTSLDREIWEASLRSLEAALAAFEPLSPRMAAVHPANYSARATLGMTPAATRPGLTAALGSRLFAALLRLKEAPGSGPLALENLEGMPLGLFLSLTEAAGVGVCLDVGHALVEGHDPAALVTDLGERLVGLHLHDAAPDSSGTHAPAGTEVERAHMALGTGRLDLGSLVTALLDRGFGGPVVLEVIGESDSSARAFTLALESALKAGGR